MMGVLIAIAVIWFWSESCFTKQERRTRRKVTWGAIGIITVRNIKDLFDPKTKY